MGSIRGRKIIDVVDEIIKKNDIVDSYKDIMSEIIAEEVSKPISKKYSVGEHVIAENLNLKISGKETRRIAQKEIRENLGRSDDFVDMLAETTGSTRIKLGRRAQLNEIKKMATDELFSNKSKNGFVKVKNEDLQSMAGDLSDSFKYVKKEYHDILLGRDAATFSNKFGIENQRIKVADRIFRDTMMRFKKNNVIMNTASHVNAFMYNQMVGLSEGTSPIAMAKYQKEATTSLAEFNKVWEGIARRKSQGKPFDRLLKRLEQNEIYKMQKLGLATNVVDGVDLSVDLIRESLGSTVLGKSEMMNTLFKNVFAESDSFIGQNLQKSFSWIDTSGRVMMVKHYMSPEGGSHSMNTSVQMANGLFGDMNQIAPKIIDALDNYAIPFAKWFASVLPYTMKAFTKNPGKYFAVMAGLYMFGVASDPDGERPRYSIRTDGWGPVLSMIDFGESSFFGGDINDMINDLGRNDQMEVAMRRLSKRILPGYVTKPAWKMRINSKSKTKGLMDGIPKSIIGSDASQNWENIDGAPLETIGQGASWLHGITGNSQYENNKRNNYGKR